MVSIIDIDHRRAVHAAAGVVADSSYETKRFFDQNLKPGILKPEQEARLRLAERHLRAIAYEVCFEAGVDRFILERTHLYRGSLWFYYSFGIKSFDFGNCSTPSCQESNCGMVGTEITYHPGTLTEPERFHYLHAPFAVPVKKRGEVHEISIDDAWKPLPPAPYRLVYPIVSTKDASEESITKLLAFVLTHPGLGKRLTPVELSRGGAILNPHSCL